MNLFRSEEHAKNWPSYEPASAQSIMPVSDWAKAFSGPLFRKRLDPDYLSRIPEYAPEMMQTLQTLGKTGSFWTPNAPVT
jgi:hypothetical protein